MLLKQYPPKVILLGLLLTTGLFATCLSSSVMPAYAQSASSTAEDAVCAWAMPMSGAELSASIPIAKARLKIAAGKFDRIFSLSLRAGVLFILTC